ncbi:hypothetical protein AAY473_034844 [Plecturocebus cupreus]
MLSWLCFVFVFETGSYSVAQLECSGEIFTHCSLDLPSSGNPPTLASQARRDGACLESQHFGRRRHADDLKPGVLGQPGQRSETLFLPKNTKIVQHGQQTTSSKNVNFQQRKTLNMLPYHDSLLSPELSSTSDFSFAVRSAQTFFCQVLLLWISARVAPLQRLLLTTPLTAQALVVRLECRQHWTLQLQQEALIVHPRSWHRAELFVSNSWKQLTGHCKGIQ